MPETGKKLAIGVGVIAGVSALIYALVRKVKAAPPIIYTCPYCEAEFATKAKLLAHIAAQHPEEPPEVWYTCSYCGAKFTTEEELLAHIELEHPTAPSQVIVYLKNPPSGANKWQLIIYDWNEISNKYNFGLGIEEPASFDIPPEWEFPLRVDILIYTVDNGEVYYRMHSTIDTFPQFHKDIFIPYYGNYYFNVATEQFEEI